MKTDGITLRLDVGLADGVVQEAVAAASPLRGEIIIRALRRFLLRETGCDPFQADILRKVVLSGVLNANKTLATMEVADISHILAGMDAASYGLQRDGLVNGMLAGTGATERAQLETRYRDWYDGAWPMFESARSRAQAFDTTFLLAVARDLLVHSMAVVVTDSAAQLVGASDGDIGYFYDPTRRDIYLFDTVDGGNGYAETIRRFLHIPPLQRILHSRGHSRLVLPDADGFQLLEEALGDCPAQSATRVTFDAVRSGVLHPQVWCFLRR